jgi:hypothetical protein
MKGIYNNKIVTITKLVTKQVPYITHPVLIQVKIEWTENGEVVDDYVDANKVEFNLPFAPLK